MLRGGVGRGAAWKAGYSLNLISTASPVGRIRQELLKLRNSIPEFEYVFVNAETGRPLVEIKKAFRGACRDAGIADFHFHDARHKAATRRADASVDAFTIAENLGHTTMQMTKRYTHALGENKRQAVEALSGYAEKNCLGFVTDDKRQAS